VAAATIYGGKVDKTPKNTLLRILPMTFDVNAWNYFMTTGQDQGGGPPNINSGSYGTIGQPQLQVYPSIKFTANFGELSLDQGNDGSSTIAGWIQNGVPYSDLHYEYNASPNPLLPLSTHNAIVPFPQPDWKGNPGLRTSTIHALNNYGLGQTYLLPLYKPVTPYNMWAANGVSQPADVPLQGFNSPTTDPSKYVAGTGNGSQYYYSIVQFVAVTITSATDQAVIVQPSSIAVPDPILQGIFPVSAPQKGTRIVTTFAAPKLTQ
jgi:hypothetical protein